MSSSPAAVAGSNTMSDVRWVGAKVLAAALSVLAMLRYVLEPLYPDCSRGESRLLETLMAASSSTPSALCAVLVCTVNRRIKARVQDTLLLVREGGL